jgi:GNAT superfamily N-acetyltransferase
MSPRSTTVPSVTCREATPADAPKIAVVRCTSAEALTAKFGRGPWSSRPTERGVLSAMRHSKIVVAVDGTALVGVLRLATKKPWAIDTAYFTPCQRPIYLTDMAVLPDVQRRGIGRLLLEEARHAARAWGGDALRLDAYDAEAGAGAFYIRCGFEERGHASYRGTPLVYFQQSL